MLGSSGILCSSPLFGVPGDPRVGPAPVLCFSCPAPPGPALPGAAHSQPCCSSQTPKGNQLCWGQELRAGK